MKAAIKFTIFSLFVLFIFTQTCYSQSYGVTQLTNNSYLDYEPTINNNYIAWSGGIGGSSLDLFLYDGLITTQITTDQANHRFTRVNSTGEVAWAGGLPVPDIYLYSNSTINQITNTPYSESDPWINSLGQIVWTGHTSNSSEIFFYDGNTITQLTNNSYNDDHARISDNGKIVWEGHASGSTSSGTEIFLFDGVSITQLTNNSTFDREPRISSDGNYVTWAGINGSDFQIFLYDGASTTQITNSGCCILLPEINNNGHIVWSSYDPGISNSSEIYYYDGNTITQLTNNLFDEGGPRINNQNKVVWSASTDIYFYDGISNISLLSHNGAENLGIDDKGNVTWSNHSISSLQQEIHIATPYLMDLSVIQNNVFSSAIGEVPPSNIQISLNALTSIELDVSGVPDSSLFTACYGGNLDFPYQNLVYGVDIYLTDSVLLGLGPLINGELKITNFFCPPNGCINPALQCFTYQYGINNVVENVKNLGVIEVMLSP